MSLYEVPEEYFFSLHQCRPRFKNDLENVLGYVAFSIVGIGEKQKQQFKIELDKELKSFKDNTLKKYKTIANWRTEISALFNLYYEEDDFIFPTQLAVDLANDLNL